MYQLLTIDHLVHHICSYVRHHELPVLARVSSTWFRYAISHLYKNVRLEEALAPLGKPDSVNHLSDNHLERLLKYTPYVRSLRIISFEDESIVIKVICKSLSKGIPYLFPNVRSLEWRSIKDSPEWREIALGLVSPKINQLRLEIEDHRPLYYLCPLIMTRLLALYSLSLEWWIRSNDHDEDETLALAESSLVEPLQGLFHIFTHTLTSIQISPCLGIPSITECLSKMSSLCNLTIGIGFPTMQLKGKDVYGDKERFPSLRSLSFDGVLSSFYSMFANPVDNLSILTISSFDTITPTDVGELISFIILVFPQIQCLTFGERVTEWSDYPSTVVPWHYIQPISRCKRLSSLTLKQMHVSVTIEELTEFLKIRATWTCLDILTSSPLRPQDILLYAKHCPNLECLGIHLDETAEFGIENLPSDIPTFSTLDLINLDYDSHIVAKSSSRLLAEFLYNVCNKRFFEIMCPDHQFNDLHVIDKLVELYREEEHKTGKPMSSEARKFVEDMTSVF